MLPPRRPARLHAPPRHQVARRQDGAQRALQHRRRLLQGPGLPAQRRQDAGGRQVLRRRQAGEERRRAWLPAGWPAVQLLSGAPSPGCLLPARQPALCPAHAPTSRTPPLHPTTALQCQKQGTPTKGNCEPLPGKGLGAPRQRALQSTHSLQPLQLAACQPDVTSTAAAAAALQGKTCRTTRAARSSQAAPRCALLPLPAAAAAAAGAALLLYACDGRPAASRGLGNQLPPPTAMPSSHSRAAQSLTPLPISPPQPGYPPVSPPPGVPAELAYTGMRQAQQGSGADMSVVRLRDGPHKGSYWVSGWRPCGGPAVRCGAEADAGLLRRRRRPPLLLLALSPLFCSAPNVPRLLVGPLPPRRCTPRSGSSPASPTSSVSAAPARARWRPAAEGAPRCAQRHACASAKLALRGRSAPLCCRTHNPRRSVCGGGLFMQGRQGVLRRHALPGQK